MKKIILLSILTTLCYSLFSQEPGIKFSHDSIFTELLIKSEKLNKPIFIDCYTKWCGPCKKMAKEVFTQKEVGDFYNEQFINAKFDMESKEGSIIREKYKVEGFPTLLFLNSKGEMLHVSLGSRSASDFVELGKIAIDDTRNFKYYNDKINKGDRSSETITQYLKAYPEAPNKATLLNDYFKTLSKEQLITQESWNMIKSFIRDIENPQFKYVLKHRQEFEDLVGKEEVSNKILNGFGYYSYVHKDDPEKVESLEKIDPELYAAFQLQNNFYIAFAECRRDNTNSEKWTTLITLAKEYFPKANKDPMNINNLCWEIYKMQKEAPNKEALNIIKEWSQYTCEKQPNNHFFNDTYAHILFDLGNIDDAIKYEEKALLIAGKDNTEQYEFYTNELKRFQKALNKN